MMATSTLLRCLPLVFGLLLVGCGGDGATDVRGSIVVDGAKPDLGTIRFESTGPTGGPAEEFKIENGAFQGRATTGPKKVVIYAQKKIGEHHVQGPGSPLVPELKQLLPAKFNEKSTLTAEIKSGGEPLTFDLQTK